MKIGSDLFRILNFAIAIIRLFASIFGDEDDKQAVEESKARSANTNPDDMV